MKTSWALLAAVMVGLTLGAVSAPASADGYHGGGYHGGGYYRGGYYGGPRVTFGFYGGPGWWGPGYWGPGYGYGYGYPYGYGYVPPVVVVPSEPRVYVERDAPAAAPSAGPQQWWYWCPSAKGYYPYVSTCSDGWQRVPPQPPQAPQ
jgi:hypothetical protein